VIEPRIAGSLWMGDGQGTIELFGVGARAAFSWRISTLFELMPELTLMWSPVQFNGEVETSEKLGATVITLGLGAGFWF